MAELNDDIEKYLNGQLSPAEMHALEKKALSDPFLAEALEGAASIPPEAFVADVKEVQARLHQKKSKRIWFTPLRIAAAIILLIGATFVIYTFVKQEEPVTLAEKSTLEQPKSAPPADSTPARLDSLKEKPQENLLSLNPPQSQPEKPKAIVETNATQEPIKTLEPAGELRDDHAAAGAAEKSADESQVKVEEEAKDQDKNTVDRKAKIVAAEQGPAQALKKKEEVAPEVLRSKTDVSSASGRAVLQRVITGQITGEDNAPIPGVNVIVQGTTEGAVTDVKGIYQLVTNSATNKLIFSFIGYQTQEVTIPAGQSQVNAQLVVDVSALSEVVVVALGQSSGDDVAKEEEPVQLAEPIGGKRAYNRYLEKNLRYPREAIDQKIEGKVTVEFAVNPHGTLSDFKVIRGLGAGCNDEVVRLVKEGPGWKASKRAETSIRSTVRVRVKFKIK